MLQVPCSPSSISMVRTVVIAGCGGIEYEQNLCIKVRGTTVFLFELRVRRGYGDDAREALAFDR